MRLYFIRVAVLLALVGVCPAWAAVIHESASLGPTGQTGGAVFDTTQFVGARFQVTSPVNVTAIGGHMSYIVGGSFFGAIVSLSGSTALPTGSPFDGTVVASTTFTLDDPTSSDYRTPLSVALGTGWYGLVFGAGQFGATDGVGALAANDTKLPAASYFAYYDSGAGYSWMTDAIDNSRFVVEGSEIPEPSTCLLLAWGLMGLAVARRRP